MVGGFAASASAQKHLYEAPRDIWHTLPFHELLPAEEAQPEVVEQAALPAPAEAPAEIIEAVPEVLKAPAVKSKKAAPKEPEPKKVAATKPETKRVEAKKPELKKPELKKPVSKT